MLEAFAEYDSYDIPSSAMNESVSAIKQSIQNGSEQAILCCIDGKPLGSVRFKMDEDSLYFSDYLLHLKQEEKESQKR